MNEPRRSCVLLADRRQRMIECLRDMLEAEFETLFIVAGEASLLDGAARLLPAVVILDLSLVPGRLPQVLEQLAARSPGTRRILLMSHGEASAVRFALESGADAVVLTRCLASDLIPAIHSVLDGRPWPPPGTGSRESDTGDPIHDPGQPACERKDPR